MHAMYGLVQAPTADCRELAYISDVVASERPAS